ncbi:MAG: glutamate-1-semialdehyde 2,1-aminomutase [Verrucomicrobiales bacterium]
MTSSEDLFQRSQACIPGGVNSPVRAFRSVGGQPFFVKRAEGAWLEDVDGKRYIDYVLTWGPAIFGHNDPYVAQAVAEAAGRGLSFGIPHPGEVTLAELVCSMVPSVEKVRMVNSGTEATMSCLRLARGYTGRDVVVKFNGCYHGHVDSLLVKAGSGALTHGEPDSAGVPADLARLTLTCEFNDLNALEQIFSSRGPEIAAVILEPVPANAGLYLPKPGFLERLRALCTQAGAVLIFDEVMTGFRLGPGGAQEIYGIRPDLTALGKVIGGGLPVGAFGGRAEIMDHLSPLGKVYQAGTLSGNPLAMAAGTAQLQRLQDVNGWTELEKIGSTFESMVRGLLEKHSLPWQLQRIGSMFCLYFTEQSVWNLPDAMTADRNRFTRFFHTCLSEGVYIAPSPFEAGFLSLAHQPEELEKTAEVFEKALLAAEIIS